MKNLIEKIKAWVLSIPTTRLIAFICGETLAAVLALTLTRFVEWIIVPLIVIAAVAMFACDWHGKPTHWRSWLFFLAGGLIIQILAWL